MLTRATSLRFDVICAGEARWRLAPALDAGDGAGSSPPATVRPSGVVRVAATLARAGRRVALVSSVADDLRGRRLVERLSQAGVNVEGVTFGPASAGLVFVASDGRHGEVVAYRDQERPFVVPEAMRAPVLLLSGSSPVVAHAASLCRAARAARRHGAFVVVDVNVRPSEWRRQDPRMVRTLLREVDLVRCTAADLAVLGLAADELRAQLRPSATLVRVEPDGRQHVSGPLGELAAEPGPPSGAADALDGDRQVAHWCAELARHESVERLVGRWRTAAST